MQRIEQLEGAQLQLREANLANTKCLNQRHAEEIAQMQHSLREAGDHRHADAEKHRKVLHGLQCQVDKLGSENTKLQTERM